MTNSSIRFRGFTLVELMTVLAIVGILAATAVPSFVAAVRNARLTSAANQLVTSLNYARNEAVKRGQYVVARKTSTEWESGWEVFVDTDKSNAFNDDNDSTLCEATEDCRLRLYEGLPANFTLRANNFSTYISYRPTGESNTFGSFAICDNSDGSGIPKSRTARLVTVINTGRINQGRDTNNDGIPDGLTSCTNP